MVGEVVGWGGEVVWCGGVVGEEVVGEVVGEVIGEVVW